MHDQWVGGELLGGDATTGWSLAPTTASHTINAFWARDASDLWAVGQSNTILRYDGASWQQELFLATDNEADLTAVVAFDATEAIAVGRDFFEGESITVM